jgi:hypothetical protein
MKILLFILLFATSVSAQTFSAAKYYQLADGNEWRYTAPPGWKDGDYISRIATNRESTAFRHYDATKAAKLLSQTKEGIIYSGEVFANAESIAKFDNPILWFPAKLRIGESVNAKTAFTRTYKDGKTMRGTFEIKQKIAAVEDVTVTAGTFKRCLRVESETFWELGDGRKARSINVYHYAPKVGVIKASARFIVMNEQGRELINRLVETDLKSATVNGKQVKAK